MGPARNFPERMNRSQLRTILWLRWRLTRNQWAQCCCWPPSAAGAARTDWPMTRDRQRRGRRWSAALAGLLAGLAACSPEQPTAPAPAAPVSPAPRALTPAERAAAERQASNAVAGLALPAARPFRMGFTGFVYDQTPEAVAATRQFTREHGDIIAHQLEGVPWAEALSGAPFPAKLLEEWANKKLGTPPGGQVYLALSPGRGDLKLADHAQPLPAELQGKTYDDPVVQRAYLAYCRRSLEFFQPDYLAIGIEVNEIRLAGPEAWRAYTNLHQRVYAALKQEHPHLPIFASFALHSLFRRGGVMPRELKTLLPWNDVVAVSYYPFFLPDADRFRALAWLFEEFDAAGKPYAFVETNDGAEPLALPGMGVVIAGTPERQLEYHRRLFEEATKRQFLFLIEFVHRDYDALWERIARDTPEFFKAWRDCGLLDEQGFKRPAWFLWQRYFALPWRREPPTGAAPRASEPGRAL